MSEATRLTRAGRLTEALALLRGGPRPAAAAGDAAAPSRPGGTPPTLDMELVDGAGPVPEWRVGTAPAAGGAAAGEPAWRPTALHDLLDQLGRRGGGIGPATARAPAPPPAGARYEERLFASAVGSRRYKLYVPSRFNGEPMPLLVMLHGCTQTPDDFAAGTLMNAHAEARTFLVAYPEQCKAANPSRCWNWFRPEDQARERGEPALLAGLTRQIMAELPVRPGQVFIAGLSAGGAAAAVMGALHPDLYAAIGVHSGLPYGVASDMPSALTAMRHGPATTRPWRGVADRPVPVIVFHGDRDGTVHPRNGARLLDEAAAAAGLRTTVSRGRSPGGLDYTRTVGSDGAGRGVVEHWLVHGAGHAWSGGSAAGSYTEPRGPDASREIVRFCLDQVRP